MPGIWREGLHEMLWLQRTAGDLVEINQVELADQLCVTKYTVNRVLKELVDAGRLAPEGDRRYRVADPEGFQPG